MCNLLEQFHYLLREAPDFELEKENKNLIMDIHKYYQTIHSSSIVSKVVDIILAKKIELASKTKFDYAKLFYKSRLLASSIEENGLKTNFILPQKEKPKQ